MANGIDPKDAAYLVKLKYVADGKEQVVADAKETKNEVALTFQQLQEQLRALRTQYNSQDISATKEALDKRKTLIQQYDKQNITSYKDTVTTLANLDKSRLDSFGNVIKQQRSQMEAFADYAKHWALRFAMYWAIFKGLEVLKDWTFGFVDLAREMKRASEVSGFTIEEWQKLEYAARINLITQEKMLRYIDNMNKALDNLGRGRGDAPEVFRKLKLEYADLIKMNPEQKFYAIVDALSKTTSQTDKARAAQVLFGKDSRYVFALIKDGAEGIKKLGDEFERFGGIITEETATLAFETAKFNENLKTMLQKSKIFWGSFFLDLMAAWRWVLGQMSDEENAYWTSKLAKTENYKAIENKQKEHNKEMLFLTQQYGDDVEKIILQYQEKGTYPESGGMGDRLEKSIKNVIKLRDEIDIIHGIQDKANESVDYAAKLWGILGDTLGGDDGVADVTEKTSKIMSQIAKDVKEAGEAAAATTIQLQSYKKQIDGIITSWEEYARKRNKESMTPSYMRRGEPAKGEPPFDNEFSVTEELEAKYQWGMMSNAEAFAYKWKEAFSEIGEQWGKFNEETEKYEASMSKMLGNIAVGFENILVNGVQAIGDAIGDCIVNGGKFGDVLKQILKQMLSSIISLIAQALIFEGILALMNIIVPNSGTAFATAIAAAGGALTQGQGIDMSGFNSDTENAKGSFMSGFFSAMGGSAFSGLGGIGFFDKGGYYDLSGRQKSLPIFDTGGYWTGNGGGNSQGFPAILHPYELVIPEKVLRNMGGGGSKIYASVNVYGANLTDKKTQRRIGKQLADIIYDTNRGRI